MQDTGVKVSPETKVRIVREYRERAEGEEGKKG
jgi:hypothetical protein